MAYEQKPGQGAIFKNEKRSEKAPDYRGNIITPSGEKLDIALWLTTAQSGHKYFSVVVKEPYKAPEEVTAAPAYASDPAPAPISQPDDLPF